MSAFANFIAKMDEHDLASAVEQGERTLSHDGRLQLVEAIFDAFRSRGESSEDAAEGSGAALEAICAGDAQAVHALIAYARTNAGLLKEAIGTLAESQPQIVSGLSPVFAGGMNAALDAT